MLKYVLIPASLILLIFLWVRFQEKFGIFFPTVPADDAVSQLPDSIEFVEFESTDGTKLTGLWKAGTEEAPVIVMAHGNGGNMFDRLFWLEEAIPGDWNGFIFDYRGYGLSEGSPHESGIYQDAIAAVQEARSRRPDAPFLLHGRSLGVTAIAYASMKIQPDGLILESGFPSGTAIGKSIIPLPGIQYFMSVEFNTTEYVSRARDGDPFPVLVIHGKKDEIVPFALGKELYETLEEPKSFWQVHRAGHNNLFSATGNEYPKRLEAFYRKYLLNTQSQLEG